MWRYQPSATEFGTVTWACHVGCGDYTTWRLRPEVSDRHRKGFVHQLA